MSTSLEKADRVAAQPRLRIGLVASSFPRTHGDPAGSFVLGFARALVRRGHRVEVLAPEPRERVEPLREEGIDVVHVPYLRPRALQRTFYGAGAPDNLARDPLAWIGVLPYLWALRRAVALRLDRWDAAVSHWALPSGLVVGEVLGPFETASVPHLVVCHSADVHVASRVPFARALAAAITTRASGLLFVSSVLRNRWLSTLGPLEGAAAASRCHVSPMGVDPCTGAPSRREARGSWRMTKTTLLTLARLVPVKGLDVLVAATAGRRDVEVIVAGEGPERDRLARSAARFGAPLRFVGVVEGAAKAALLAGADALVLPSRELGSGRTEGVPVAMLEAMAAGLPVIASSVGGVPSLAEPRDAALLVPPDDPRALGEAITRLASSGELRRRLARRGRTVARALEWDRLAPSLERLLRPVLPSEAPGAS